MKRSVLFILALSFVLLASSFVSAVCCEKVKSGDWCQDVSTVDDCVLTGDLRWNSASCDRTTYCALGTCINVNYGVCSPNTEMTVCEKEGGQWDVRNIDEIEMCQNGCCVLGEQVAFVTSTECERLATKYSVDSIFRSDVKAESACYDLSQPTEVGACVFEEDYTKDCKMITKESCLAQDGKFNRGLLCTAPGLSDCAKSSKTVCKDEKVYFLDSCGNLANVYDSRMFSSLDSAWNQEMEDYWTNIQDPKCSIKANGADSCGDCNYLSGTTCSEYKAGLTQPDYGNNVCKSLSCEYNGETYEHGESWCASGSGLNPGINVDPKTGYITESERKKLINNYESLNLPGTEYMKLQCWDGEVIEYPCDPPFRETVCKQAQIGEYDNFSIAQCMVNDWKSCVLITNKEDCESKEIDCKWITGERFDGAITSEATRDNQQGSCVPLIAPGFRFWDSTSNETGSEICILGLSTINVLYETNWKEKRANFEKFDLDASDGTSVHQDCLENCYAIPNYGDDLKENMEALWNGENVANLQYEEVSLRNGYYCSKESDSSKNKIGSVNGDNVNCIERALNQEGWFDDLTTNSQRRLLPIFYTNSDWLAFLSERTRSLGDCGYKLGASGDYSSTQSEIITAMFQKLTQDQTVKEDVTETCIIYEANEDGLLLKEDNYYRSGGTCSEVYIAQTDTNE